MHITIIFTEEGTAQPKTSGTPLIIKMQGTQLGGEGRGGRQT
jgi:hypothetical protein